MTISLEGDVRLTVYDPGVTSLGGTVDFQLDKSDISGVDSLGGTRARPLQAKSESLDWKLRTLDLNEAVTGNLYDSAGRPRILNRLARFETQYDAGGYDDVAVGRIAGVRQTENVREFQVTFSDEGHVLRSTKAFGPDGFGGATTTAVFPAGVRSAWRRVQAIGQLHYKVKEANADGSVRLELDNLPTHSDGRQLWKLMSAAKQLIQDDLKAEASIFNFSASLAEGSGDFETLRFHENTSGTDYEVFAPGDLTPSFEDENWISFPWDDPNDSKIVDAKDRPEEIWIYDPDGDFAQGNEGFAHLYMPSHEPTQDLPRHFGGSSGVQPWQHVKDGLDAIGARYDAAAINDLIGTSEPIYPRVTENPSMDAYLRRQVLIPEGYMLAPKADGTLTPIPIGTPTNDEIPDVTQTALLDKGSIRGPEYPTWEHTRREQKTVLRWTIRHPWAISPQSWTDESRPSALDLFNVSESTEEREHDRVDEFGRDPIEYEISGFEERRRYQKVIDARSESLLNRYGDGSIMSTLATLRAHESEEIGDYVRIDLDDFPNGELSARGGIRLVQIVERTSDLRPGVSLNVLDAGPEGQPLDASNLSISASQNSDDSETAIDIAVSGFPADATGWLLEYAQSATDPANSSPEWREAGSFDVSTTSTTVTGLEAGLTYWFRIRVFAPDTISSAWSSHASASTAGLPSISGLSIDSITGSKALISWSLANFSLPVRVTVQDDTAGTTLLERRLDAETQEYLVTGLTSGNSYTVIVQHVRGSSTGPTTTSTFSAGASNDQLAAPDYIAVQYGRSYQRGGQRDGTRSGIVVYVEPRDPAVPLVFERAEDDGSDNPDTNTIVTRPQGPGTGRYVDTSVSPGSNGGDGYWYRAFHRDDGYVDSAATEWARAWPVVLPERFGPPPSRPLVDLDVRLDDEGNVSIYVDGEPRVRSFRYDVGTGGFGSIDPSTGTLVTTDAQGNQEVTDITAINQGETVYVEIETYPDEAGADTPTAQRSQSLFRPGTGAGSGVDPVAQITYKPNRSGPDLYRFDLGGQPGNLGGVINDLEARVQILETSLSQLQESDYHDGDGNSGWASTSTGNPIISNFTVPNDEPNYTESDIDDTDMLVLEVRDTSVGSPGSHPKDRAFLPIGEASAIIAQASGVTVYDGTDPGEATGVSEGEGHISAVVNL